MSTTVDLGDGASVTSSDESEEAIRSAFDAPSEATESGETARPADGAGKADDSADVLAAQKPGDKKKARVDPHARMLEATAKEAEAKRERDEARAEIEAIKRERDALKAARETPRSEPAKPQATAVADDPEPDPKEYPGEDYDPKYLKDMARWSGRQEAREFVKQQAMQQRQHQQMQAERHAHETWLTTFEAARAKEPDFWAQLDPEMPLNAPTRDFIKQSKTGLDVFRHLVENPDLARRLATLPPDQTFREIGKIEMRLEAALSSGPVSKPPVISHAKPLIKPVSASPTVSDDVDDSDDMSEAAIARHFKRENAKDPRINPNAHRH